MMEQKYKIIPHSVHKEKGIKTLCKELDRLLKEVHKDYKLLDKYYNKKCRILEISDKVVYSTDYPLCDDIRDDEVCVCYKYIKRTAVMESRIISRDYSYDCSDLCEPYNYKYA